MNKLAYMAGLLEAKGPAPLRFKFRTAKMADRFYKEIIDKSRLVFDVVPTKNPLVLDVFPVSNSRNVIAQIDTIADAYDSERPAQDRFSNEPLDSGEKKDLARANDYMANLDSDDGHIPKEVAHLSTGKLTPKQARELIHWVNRTAPAEFS